MIAPGSTRVSRVLFGVSPKSRNHTSPKLYPKHKKIMKKAWKDYAVAERDSGAIESSFGKRGGEQTHEQI
jgi:hypothetical protein